jgi:uncharacterized protein involved in exopolysaccharide biosynthesis
MSDPHLTVPIHSREEELSLLEMTNTVLRSWRVIVVVPVLLAILVGIASLMQERRYAARATFMPQAAEGRRPSDALGLARQFGFDVGSAASTQSPLYFVELLGSQRLLRRAVETEYTVAGVDGGERRGNLIELFEIEAESGARWRKSMEALSERIATNVATETGIIRMTVWEHDPALAEQIAARLLQLLHEYNLEVVRERAEQEGRFLTERIEVARSELDASENDLGSFLRQNRGYQNSPELLFDHERLRRQVAIRQEIYISLLRSYEQLRMDAVRETPLLTVIDHPVGSAEPQGRGTIVRMIVAFLAGLVLAVFAAFLMELSRRRRAAGDPQYRELQGLASAAWHDLRRPSRWLRRAGSGAG